MGIREDRRRATVARILAAAGAEFEERGYESASYGSIATRAGVAKSLVSYHFATKADMAARVVAEAFPQGTFLNTEPSPDGPLSDIVQSTAEVARAFTTNPLARASLRLVNEQSLQDPAAPRPYVGWVARMSDDLRAAAARGLITMGVDTHREATILVGLFVGIRYVTDTLDERDAFVDLAVTTIRQRLVFLGADEASLPATAAQ
ncbi:TetR family transcriptional regulator [Frondihabitans sp. PhB188]|uniref:TetR/AcrR family transcriptional regulator n=1 Tax=Frondihabitans sp. PhB188 TaxID=2485200 RepID=UPI000F46C832|nr:TetR/AcrR family transcriptional regulator [Frondihabitans sp. PhB188]ROQ39647.1 TetR family transcriptional regulator [Frondihabitans sp. PhB188]